MHYILTYQDTVEPLLNSISKILPEPDKQAKQQSHLLVQRIQAACERTGGWIN